MRSVIGSTVSAGGSRRAVAFRQAGLRVRLQAVVRAMSTSINNGIKLAVLHQAIEPPIIGGVRKAMKPGGYRDSSADIAYVLRNHSQSRNPNGTANPAVEVITPTAFADPAVDKHWSFPDTKSSIISAITEHKVTHLWVNTILFTNHPLQTVELPDDLADNVCIVGQPPRLVEKYDDKNWINEMLKKDPRFKLPKSWIISLDKVPKDTGLQEHLAKLDLPYPTVGKPIRGRGSHGVKLCRDLDELAAHLDHILGESPQIMIEEYLAGQEGTVTVMPPSSARPKYWALPVIERFNHADGVAPYNGVVAVMANSSVVPLDVQGYSLTSEGDTDLDAVEDTENAYVDIRTQCKLVAEQLGCTAPIRIDVRRKREGDGSTSENPFVMFDVNMKPNMTGPGRPGREDQASLTAMAAEALGWNYARLLHEMLQTAQPLSKIRKVTLPKGWD